MEIQCFGAARTVTGSKHLVTSAGGARILLDCGLFQGHRRESIERNRTLGFDPEGLDAVVLSHAHIDHSGALPILVRSGYDGPIYATPATRDLCASMLMDAASIQESDARYVNHRIAREGVLMDPVTPLFSERDVLAALDRMVCLPYHHRHPIARGVDLFFFDAGHVLGSAITALDVDDERTTKRLVFTGDLGRKNIPILRDPECVPGAHVLVSESTYGDRLHPPFADMHDELAKVLVRVHDRGGKVIVPSFALERAQEIIFTLKALSVERRIPRQPVYVDSPLAVKLTDVFRLHPECFDEDARALVQRDDGPFDFEDLRYVSSPEDSKNIDAAAEPCVVIAGSGMCEGGRVLHHLRSCVEDEKNCILVVGFQAEDTLGRRIVEHRSRVRIFGVERDLRAEVVVLAGFSAHADQRELVEYAEETRRRGPLHDIVLVHGEPPAQAALREQLVDRGMPIVHTPALRDVVRL